jgi:hypothetical protein
MSRRRRARSCSEYFLAALGLALLAFVVALIATSRSCRVGLSPEVGISPSSPTPVATPPPSR